jgi:hypothetical protein
MSFCLKLVYGGVMNSRPPNGNTCSISIQINRIEKFRPDLRRQWNMLKWREMQGCSKWDTKGYGRHVAAQPLFETESFGKSANVGASLS